MSASSPQPTRQSIRKPVRHPSADSLILLMLLSFAASVVVTRVFLQVTGFPKLGGESGLHIAHVLWGGLLLFSATLLPLIFLNSWAYSITAVLSGVGVGLFIDEVGKFITSNNDYFFPAAAPIIYGFFLLTVLLYFQIRRHPTADARSELYYALIGLTEALDYDLDAHERDMIQQRLVKVKLNAARPEQAQLAQELLDFLQSDKLPIVEHRLTWLERQVWRIKKIEAQYVPRSRHRALLIAGAVIFGLIAIYDPLRVWSVTHSASLNPTVELLNLGYIREASEMTWLTLRLILEGVVGVALIVSAGLLLVKHDRQGVMIGSIGMLFYLITVNLFLLYFNQFTFILVSVIEFGFYLNLARYRQRFIFPREPALALHL